MTSKPRPFVWWRRRAAEAARVPEGRFISRERVRALGSAGLVGVVAWTFFYYTLGNHRVEQLDEFARYLKGEDLYRKYEVSRITWNCESLRQQFAEAHIAKYPDRMARDGQTLVFRRGGLDRQGFGRWVDGAMQQLAFGKERKIEHDGALLPAMMVRLFDHFRFEGGALVETLPNDFSHRCGR